MSASVSAPAPVLSRLIALGLALPAMVVTVYASLIGMSDREMWNDEYASWYASTLSLGDLAKLLRHIDMVVAPYYLMMHGWIALFGDSPLALRLPSALAMGGAAGLVVLVGRRLFGAAVGVTAGLLFALVPTVSRYGQETRPYAFAMLAACLATLLLLRAIEHPTWRRWLLYGASLTVAGWGHIVTVTIVVAHLLYLWRAGRTRADFRLWRCCAGLALAVTLVLPLVSEGSKQSGAIDWIKAGSTAVRTFPERMVGSAVLAAVLAGLAGLGVVGLALAGGTRRTALALLVGWAVFPPVFCYVTFDVLHLFLYRYLLFTLPAWILLSAFAVVGLAGMVPWRAIRVPVRVVLVLIAVVGVAALGRPDADRLRRSPVFGEPDFRAAASLIASDMELSDAIVYGGAFRNGRRAMAYELRSRPNPADVLLAIPSRELGTFGSVECVEPSTCLRGAPRIWLLTTTRSSDAFAELPPGVGALLRAEFRVSYTHRFSGVRLVLLTRTAVSAP